MQIIKDKYTLHITTVDGTKYHYTIVEDEIEKIKNQIKNQRILEIEDKMYPVRNICRVSFEKKMKAKDYKR